MLNVRIAITVMQTIAVKTVTVTVFRLQGIEGAGLLPTTYYCYLIPLQRNGISVTRDRRGGPVVLSGWKGRDGGYRPFVPHMNRRGGAVVVSG